MKKNRLYVCGILALSVLAGCASVDKPTPGIEAAKAAALQQGSPAIDNVRISDFSLGPGDTISIEVYRQDDLKRTVKIDPSGRMMFPLIGDVQITGKSIFKVRDELQERLAKYIVNPQVTINVTTSQSHKIIVLGEVNSPGVMPLDSDLSIIEAISMSGGLTADAETSNVLLIKKGPSGSVVSSIDVNRIYKDGDMSGNAGLAGGDIIYVPATKISNVSWYFSHLSKILSPIVNLESGIVLFPQVKDTLTKGRNTVPVTVQAR